MNDTITELVSWHISGSEPPVAGVGADLMGLWLPAIRLPRSCGELLRVRVLTGQTQHEGQWQELGPRAHAGPRASGIRSLASADHWTEQEDGW